MPMNAEFKYKGQEVMIIPSLIGERWRWVLIIDESVFRDLRDRQLGSEELALADGRREALRIIDQGLV